VADGVQRAARTTVEVDVVGDPRAVEASVDPTTMQAVENAVARSGARPGRSTTW
jgi:hypothetical protein